MKAVILCAGYATRLYPLTENIPKSLLPIRKKPLVDFIIEKLDRIEEINTIYIVTNDKFYKNFKEWADNSNFKKELKIINDKTTSNENRLGGIGDLAFVIEKENINEEIFVILGDNLFDFDLEEMIALFKKTNESILGVYKMKKIPKSQKLGIVSIKENLVFDLIHDIVTPESNLISTGLYIFTRSDIKRIKDYMQTSKPKDGPGFLIIDWLNSKKIYAALLEGKWYDIGTKEIYEKIAKK